MFDLKRPCVNCPFRKGQGRLFSLARKRLEEIRRAPAFQCHRTVDYENFDDAPQGAKPEQCAGLMAVLLREGEPNQIMQVAERLECVDFSDLDPRREAYARWWVVLREHGRRNR